MPAKEISLTCGLWRTIPMCSVRFVISTYYRKEVERQLKTAQQLGHLRQVKYLLAVLAVVDGQSFSLFSFVVHRHLHSVPTRRSADLRGRIGELVGKPR